MTENQVIQLSDGEKGTQIKLLVKRKTYILMNQIFCGDFIGWKRK